MTYDKEALIALRERVREAEGADREIDALLWAEFDGRDVRWQDPGHLYAKSRQAPHDECLIAWRAVNGNVYVQHEMCHQITPLTASIDAALALVERVLPGWFNSSIKASEGYLAYIWQTDHSRDFASKGLASRPLAILDALLTALIEQETAT